VPKAPNHTTVSVQFCQTFGSETQRGKKCSADCQAINTSATQRTQRGTNRPSGKRHRNRLKEAAPKKWRKATGVSQAGCRAASAAMVRVKVAVPKVSSARETNSAMRSSDLRREMSAAIAPYTVAKTMSIATE
jgi:hypothetical protein